MSNKCGFTLARTARLVVKHGLDRAAWLMVVVLLGASMPGYAQQDTAFEGDKTSVRYLKYLFKEDKSIGIPYQYLEGPYKNRIPAGLVDRYLPHSTVSNPKRGYYAGKLVINNENFLGLAYEKPCYKGNLCHTRYLTTLKRNGELIDHTVLGYDSSSSMGLDTMRSQILQQRLIEKVLIRTDYPTANQNPRKSKVSREYSYQMLSDNGTLRPIPELQKSPNRQFPWSAKRLVQPSELEEFTRREQNILKNEIFADYQFRFPSERWRSYFSEKPWYEPRSENVSDSLNLIERFNIKRLIQHQRNDS